MKYYLSTIADVTEAEGDDWGKLAYADKTAPIVAANGMGIEIAEFCISENMDVKFEEVLPHVLKNAEASPDKTLHAPYNELFPQAVDPLVVEMARKRYAQSLEYCQRFGASKLVVHANFVPSLYHPEWFVSRHIEFWKRFLAEHDDDVVICVENVQEEDPELILGILREVEDPRLMMCLDVGHANLTPVDPIDWLKACAPYISHYHIHNNFGPPEGLRKNMGDRHLSPGNGNIDMKALLTLAEELTPSATAAIESYELEESVAWLKENGFM
ncbi:MAG: sugar phosphate isomerase/epimerase [Oscillospiraceae bacterium]|nr:sugar phosphate isomerase/epimerase [Oscillospiraceae bacterium]